jgi:hypothetical protein
MCVCGLVPPLAVEIITPANTMILHDVGWTTNPKGSAAQAASWYSGYMGQFFWKHILPKMQIHRAMLPPNCQLSW